jgi:hypothetical protein
LEKNWEYNGPVHKLFIYFKKTYDSVRREVLYNILIELRIQRELVGLIKMCLNETYSADKYPIQNGLKQGDTSSQLVFNFALENAIRSVQENQKELTLNGAHHRLTNAHNHHHHHRLDSPTWTLAFLRSFCQLKNPAIASSDFVTRVFSRVRFSAPRTTQLEDLCFLSGLSPLADKSQFQSVRISLFSPCIT